MAAIPKISLAHSVVVWNVSAKDAICGAPAQAASAGLTHCLACASTVDDIFITAGRDSLRLWEVNVEDRKLKPTDIKTTPYHRVIRCLYIDNDDKYFYCGTTSGDILMINMMTRKYRGIQPSEKRRYSCGVNAIGYLGSDRYVVCTGDGLVSVCDKLFNRTNIEHKLDSPITSVTMRGDFHQFYVGTTIGNTYRFNNVSDFKPHLMTTSHHKSVNGVAFPRNCSQLLVTCGYEEIRVWLLKTSQEQLRIVVPNMTCNTVVVPSDGKSIVSGWSDCCIRAYFPESGRLMYMVNKAYGSSVTAIAAYNNCQYIISGSDLGHVVVWKVPVYRKTKDINQADKQFLLKEHKATVTCIKIKKDDSNCVTSSIDGSCIIWDLNQRSRLHMLRVNTLFKYVCYHPLEHQIVTTGTDHKISFWETFDGSMIRELEGALSGAVNCIDVSPDGAYFVSGGSDKIVKFWTYEDGEVTHVGLGHSAPITGLAVSPDQGTIISISSDGAIHCWKFPPQKTPSPDVTATTENTAEARLGPIYDDEDDLKLIADDVAKEFLPLVETKAGVIMPAQESCTVPQL